MIETWIQKLTSLPMAFHLPDQSQSPQWLGLGEDSQIETPVIVQAPSAGDSFKATRQASAPSLAKDLRTGRDVIPSARSKQARAKSHAKVALSGDFKYSLRDCS